MKLFKWLRKQYEKRLPYKIVDVTLDDLDKYIGGYHPIICGSPHLQQEVIYRLLSIPGTGDLGAKSSFKRGRILVLWGEYLTDWQVHYAKRNDTFKTWLRVVESDPVDVDDLI